MTHIQSLPHIYAQSDTEVSVLLAMYRTYKQIQEELVSTERLITQTYKNLLQAPTPVQTLVSSQQTLLVHISDAMTFSNPLVWIRYKRLAYADTDHAIVTVGDLFDHCAIPDHICAKRLACIDSWCTTMTQQSITTLFLRDMPLVEFEVHPWMIQLLSSTAHLTTWQAYEWYKDQGIAKKWAQWRSLS